MSLLGDSLFVNKTLATAKTIDGCTCTLRAVSLVIVDPLIGPKSSRDSLSLRLRDFKTSTRVGRPKQ